MNQEMTKSTHYQAILFDCEGVLIENKPVELQILRSMLAQRGWQPEPRQLKALFMHEPKTNWPKIIFQQAGIQVGSEWFAAYHLKKEQAQKNLYVPVDGVQYALDKISAHWHGRMACVSSASLKKIYRQLDALNFTHFFSPHIYSGTQTKRNKPYPDVYLQAIRHLNVPAHCCVVIEDSTSGVQAGVAAGAVVLAYTAYFEPEQAIAAGASQTFNHMQQLPKLLLKQ